MSHHVYFRILGYIATLLMHITNLVAISAHMKSVDVSENTPDNIGIKSFTTLEYRYFTTWTVGLQIGYAVLSLFCDILILMNRNTKNYKLPKQIGASREIMFSGLVWPCSWVVCTIFWSIYNYDRSLIFPVFLDKVLPKVSNHVIHTAIVPVVLWEVMFRPRNTPRSHIRNLIQLTLHMAVYGCVLHFTYYERGIWLYPVFKVAHGSIHFLLLHIYIFVLCLGFYCTQWLLNYVIHGKRKVVGKTQ